MAHGFLRSFDKNLQVFSAGTSPSDKVNPVAVEVMAEAGIDISRHTPTDVSAYLDDTWDYVITVCDNANRTCPSFTGKAGKRIHMGFDDPSQANGSTGSIRREFIRVRDEIRDGFLRFYLEEIKGQKYPSSAVGR